MKSTLAKATRFSHGIVTQCRGPVAQRFTLAVIAATSLAALNTKLTAEDDQLPPARMGKAEFSHKYETYLLEDHVNYVSTGFGETLIPTTREVLKENPNADPRAVELRILVADRLYKNFSPEQFDEVADFPQHPGPGNQSLNAWVKSLQKSIVTGDSLSIRKPLAWWPLYLGVSEAFDNKSVMKWARRESKEGQVSIREVVVKAIMKAAIRHRYKESASEVYEIVSDDYSKWYDAPEDYDGRAAVVRLHKIVVERLDRVRRDAKLFGPDAWNHDELDEPQH